MQEEVCEDYEGECVTSGISYQWSVSVLLAIECTPQSSWRNQQYQQRTRQSRTPKSVDPPSLETRVRGSTEQAEGETSVPS